MGDAAALRLADAAARAGIPQAEVDCIAGGDMLASTVDACCEVVLRVHGQADGGRVCHVPLAAQPTVLQDGVGRAALLHRLRSEATTRAVIGMWSPPGGRGGTGSDDCTPPASDHFTALRLVRVARAGWHRYDAVLVDSDASRCR